MKWYHYAIIALLLTGGGVAVLNMTRGIRNKNPGNIRDNPANDWNGKVGVDDKGFVIFSNAKFGIRAIGKVFDSYRNRGFRSIEQFIQRYAPSSENDTQSYINSVVKSMGVESKYHQPSRQEGDYPDLVKAIIKHENGFNPYSDEEIIEALNS